MNQYEQYQIRRLFISKSDELDLNLKFVSQTEL